jgi:hypothetical protein
MSWSNLREARQSKQSKSFVSATAKDVPSQTNEIDQAEPFHPALPSEMEIKRSPGKGRAIYAKTAIKPGISRRLYSFLAMLLSQNRLMHYLSASSRLRPIHFTPQLILFFLFYIIRRI